MQTCFHENTSIPQKCKVQAFECLDFLGNEGWHVFFLLHPLQVLNAMHGHLIPLSFRALLYHATEETKFLGLDEAYKLWYLQRYQNIYLVLGNEGS